MCFGLTGVVFVVDFQDRNRMFMFVQQREDEEEESWEEKRVELS